LELLGKSVLLENPNDTCVREDYAEGPVPPLEIVVQKIAEVFWGNQSD